MQGAQCDAESGAAASHASPTQLSPGGDRADIHLGRGGEKVIWGEVGEEKKRRNFHLKFEL